MHQCMSYQQKLKAITMYYESSSFEENEKLKSLKPKKLDNISQNAHTVQALVEHLGTDPKKQEIKTLLTEYMKQLDTCIAFLEKNLYVLILYFIQTLII